MGVSWKKICALAGVSSAGFLSEGRGGGEEVMSGNERRILLADENIIFERVDLPSAFVIETNVYWKSVPV